MNDTHPSTDELLRFRAGDLPADELLALDDHVGTCEECRASLRGAFLENATDGWGQALGEPERDPARRRWMIVAIPAAAAAVIVLFLLFLSRNVDSPAPRRVPVQPNPIRVVVPEVVLPPDLRAVADQILGRTLPSRETVRFLNPPQGSTRGSAPAEGETGLTSPKGVVVEEDRPLFVWTPPEDAEWSRVEVFDTKLRRVAASSQTHASQWRPDAPLPRGETYLWQVRVSRQGTTTIAPAPPLPPARFKIIDTEAANEIERARASQSQLVLGLLYAREGMFDAARAAFEAHAASHPRSDLPRRLAAALP